MLYRERINPEMFFGPIEKLLHDMETPVASNAWYPAADVTERKDEIHIVLDVPGFKKENIAIEMLDSKTVIISGKAVTEEQVKEERLHRKERVKGDFTRKFLMPWEVNVENIAAHLADGVLEVVVPKAEAAKPRKIEIRTQ